MTDDLTSDDYLVALRALRDSISTDLETCESMRDRAALYNRLESVLRQINEFAPAVKEGDPIDEIAARRERRRNTSASQRRSTAR